MFLKSKSVTKHPLTQAQKFPKPTSKDQEKAKEVIVVSTHFPFLLELSFGTQVDHLPRNSMRKRNSPSYVLRMALLRHSSFFPLQYTPDWVTYIYLTVELFLFCYVMLSTLMRIGKDHMLTHFMSKPFVWKILYDCVFSSWFPSRSLFAQATYAASFKGCSVQLLLRGFKDISAKRVIVTSLFCHYSAIIPPLFVLGFEIWAHVGHVFWCSLTLEFSISLSDWPIYAYSSWGRCGNGKVYFLIIVHRV